VCRAGSGDVCDPDEKCTGTAKDTCPADVVKDATTVCNAKNGVCDIEEKCTGTAKQTCPMDKVEPSTTVCRSVAGACDKEEKCDGTAKTTCPTDLFLPQGTTCMVTKECDGQGGADTNCVAPTLPVAGAKLWLDGSNAGSITKDANDLVSQWNDLSGNGLHATLGGNKPKWFANQLNGKSTIKFDGNGVRLKTANTSIATSMTAFVVVRYNTLYDWGSIANQAHDTYWSIRRMNNTDRLNFHIQNINGGPDVTIPSAFTRVTCVQDGGNSTTIYTAGETETVNSNPMTDPGANTEPITIGIAQAKDSESCGCDIAEFILYPSALNGADRTSVETYLKNKWGTN
jgi:hypothetical protein